MSKSSKVALETRISRLEQELEKGKQETIGYIDRIEMLEDTIMRLEKIIHTEDFEKKEGAPKFELKRPRDKRVITNLSNKDRILTLLRSEILTSKELAEKLILSKQDTRTYLLRLKKEDKIKSIGKRGRFLVYTYKRPQESETQNTLLHALEYDISYVLNLLEMKMTLKKGKELSPTDQIIISRLKNRLSDKLENISKETEVLNEYINDQAFRSKISKKIAELEAKINFIVSQETVESGKEEEFNVFRFYDDLSQFQELEIQEDLQLYELLDSDFILLFVDHKSYRVWIWLGNNVTTRMKFISAKMAPSIRDRYGTAFKITAVDDGNETTAFKAMVGLEEEVDYSEVQTGPAYRETEEDLQLLKSLSREKILLLLKKTGIPEGYERKMVIVKNKIFGYKEYEREYLGSVIIEKELYPLKEEIEDGPYLAEIYIPRMLFSKNNVVLTELLHKVDD